MMGDNTKLELETSSTRVVSTGELVDIEVVDLFGDRMSLQFTVSSTGDYGKVRLIIDRDDWAKIVGTTNPETREFPQAPDEEPMW